jgi:hypothetical protein
VKDWIRTREDHKRQAAQFSAELVAERSQREAAEVRAAGLAAELEKNRQFVVESKVCVLCVVCLSGPMEYRAVAISRLPVSHLLSRSSTHASAHCADGVPRWRAPAPVDAQDGQVGDGHGGSAGGGGCERGGGGIVKRVSAESRRRRGGGGG